MSAQCKPYSVNKNFKWRAKKSRNVARTEIQRYIYVQSRLSKTMKSQWTFCVLTAAEWRKKLSKAEAVYPLCRRLVLRRKTMHWTREELSGDTSIYHGGKQAWREWLERRNLWGDFLPCLAFQATEGLEASKPSWTKAGLSSRVTQVGACMRLVSLCTCDRNVWLSARCHFTFSSWT